MRREHLNYLLFAAILLIFTGCWPPVRDISNIQEVTGTYVHALDEGKIEVVILHGDMTFEHSVYGSSEYVDTLKPLYENKGTWRYENNEIHFQPWQMMCDVEKPKTLHLNNYYSEMSISWFQPGSYGESASLVLYAETMYIFEQWQKRD